MDQASNFAMPCACTRNSPIAVLSHRLPIRMAPKATKVAPALPSLATTIPVTSVATPKWCGPGVIKPSRNNEAISGEGNRVIFVSMPVLLMK